MEIQIIKISEEERKLVSDFIGEDIGSEIDFNRLMLVVEKIYGMYEWDRFYYNPVMCHFYLTENIKILTGKLDGETDEGYCGKMKYIYKPCDPKHAIRQAVIQFIEWLNSEQSAQESDDNDKWHPQDYSGKNATRE